MLSVNSHYNFCEQVLTFEAKIILRSPIAHTWYTVMENQQTFTSQSRFARLRAQTKSAILARPFTFFIISLIALVALIGIASTINKPKEQAKKN